MKSTLIEFCPEQYVNIRIHIDKQHLANAEGKPSDLQFLCTFHIATSGPHESRFCTAAPASNFPMDVRFLAAVQHPVCCSTCCLIWPPLPHLPPPPIRSVTLTATAWWSYTAAVPGFGAHREELAGPAQSTASSDGRLKRLYRVLLGQLAPALRPVTAHSQPRSQPRSQPTHSPAQPRSQSRPGPPQRHSLSFLVTCFHRRKSAHFGVSPAIDRRERPFVLGDTRSQTGIRCGRLLPV